jgi:lipopolysaccharide transport protein LptA
VKIFCYIALIALAAAGTLRAQTNAIANTSTNANTNAVSQILALVTTNAPAAKPQPRGPTHIESDSVDFNLATREATYRGHVRVDDPQMKLSCAWLVADLPQNGSRITNIIAETNVVIDATDDRGQTMHATGNKAVYVYTVQNGVTNETVTLTGNAKVENAKGWLTGEPIILNRATGDVTASNEHMVFWQNLNGAMADTNAPVIETNAPAAETNSPVVQTNAMPAMTNQTAPPK